MGTAWAIGAGLRPARGRGRLGGEGMVACVHVARILPGKKDDFVQRIKDGFGANPQALRALGFQRITSFTTAELGDELLVTVYEVDDPSVLERFYSLQPVVDHEH